MSDSDALRNAQQTMRRFQHEVRTPLGQIIGYSELLEEELEERGQQDLVPDLEKIRKAANRLLALVDGKLRTEQSDAAPALPDAGKSSAETATSADAHSEDRDPRSPVQDFASNLAQFYGISGDEATLIGDIVDELVKLGNSERTAILTGP